MLLLLGASRETRGPSAKPLAALLPCLALALQTLFLLISGCLLTMASIPQGAFAAFKIRQNTEGGNNAKYEKLQEEKHSQHYPPANKKLVDQSPLKYNSKMMNSIWGQYNRYSVHNMKKNTDGAREALVWAEQRAATATPPAFYASGFMPNFFSKSLSQ